MPAAPGIPPAAEDTIVGADGEEIEMSCVCRLMAVTGEPDPPGEAMPPCTWKKPAHPLETSHQLLIVRPLFATANTSRC